VKLDSRKCLESKGASLGPLIAVSDRNDDGVGDFVVLSTSPYELVTISGARGEVLSRVTLGQIETGDQIGTRIAEFGVPRPPASVRILEYGWIRHADSLIPRMRVIDGNGGSTPIPQPTAPLGLVRQPGGALVLRNSSYEPILVAASTTIRSASSAPTEPGQLVVWSPWDSMPRVTYQSAVAADLFGRHIVAVGDWNKDGVNDLAASAPWATEGANKTAEAGRIDIISGSDFTLLARVFPTTLGITTQHLGLFMSGGKDFDGDGANDLVVSGDDSPGCVFAVSGNGPKLIASLRNPNPGDFSEFGRTALAVDDLDGDNTPDVVVGHADYSEPGVESVGAIYVFSGKSGACLATFVLSSAVAGSRVGELLNVVQDTKSRGSLIVLAGSSRRLDYFSLTLPRAVVNQKANESNNDK